MMFSPHVLALCAMTINVVSGSGFSTKNFELGYADVTVSRSHSGWFNATTKKCTIELVITENGEESTGVLFIRGTLGERQQLSAQFNNAKFDSDSNPIPSSGQDVPFRINYADSGRNARTRTIILGKFPNVQLFKKGATYGKPTELTLTFRETEPKVTGQKSKRAKVPKNSMDITSTKVEEFARELGFRIRLIGSRLLSPYVPTEEPANEAKPTGRAPGAPRNHKKRSNGRRPSATNATPATTEATAASSPSSQH